MPNTIEKSLVLNRFSNNRFFELIGVNEDVAWICEEILKKELGIDFVPENIMVKASDEPFYGSSEFSVTHIMGENDKVFLMINGNTILHSLQTLLEDWGYVKKVLEKGEVPLYASFRDTDGALL